jgi:hypothetical protein
MRGIAILTSLGLTLILTGCRNMDTATLQDQIQRDANARAGHYAVAAVHCRGDHTIPEETDMCVVVPADGGNPIGLLVHVDGSSYRILEPPAQLR